LNVRKITVEPMVSAAIEAKLSSTPIIYPVAHSKIKTFLINTGIKTLNISNIIRGKLPRSFILSFVTAKGCDGACTHDPFLFENFGINYMNLFINGDPIHAKAIQPDWDNGNIVKQYSWLLDNIGLHQHVSNGITLDEFKSNSCFFPYDLTPDLCNSYNSHGIEQGNLDINLGFKTELTENIIMIVYATYDECVTIDKSRNVTVV